MRKQKFMPRKLILLLSVPIFTLSFIVSRLLKLSLHKLNNSVLLLSREIQRVFLSGKCSLVPSNVKVMLLMAVGFDIKSHPFRLKHYAFLPRNSFRPYLFSQVHFYDWYYLSKNYEINENYMF